MAIKLVQNIAGSTSRSNIAKVGIGYSLNMYSETQDISEHSCQLLMRPIQGTVDTEINNLAGECRGLYRVSRGYNNKPTLYGVFGNKLYWITDTHYAYEIGNIDSVGTKCNMCETGGYGSANPHLIIVDGTHCYALNTSLPFDDQRIMFANHGSIELPKRIVNNLSERIEPTHCAYLYGYLIINDKDSDAFYTSYQYPFEAYPESDSHYYDVFRVSAFTDATKDIGFITYSEWQPDNTVALCSNGSKLYTFGTRSWQVFSFNDDVNNPFSSPDNAAGNVGIKAPNSLAMLGSTTFWLGSSDIGDNGIFMIKDTTLTRISTQNIEREISNIINPENAYAQIWQEHQHTFYAITFEDSKITYVYDVTENSWHNRTSYDESNRQTYWRYNNACFAYNKIYVGTKDGKLCYMDENKYTEHDNRPILKLRRGGVITSENCPFYIDAVELIVNNGQHSFNNQYDNYELNPRVAIRYSWDGSTWSDYEDNYLGMIGEYDYSTTYWHLGIGKYFTLEISTTEPIPFCIESLKINYSPCSNFI